MLKIYGITLFCVLIILSGVLSSSKIYFPGTYTNLKGTDNEIKKIDSRIKREATSNGGISSSNIYFPGTYPSSKGTGREINTKARITETSTAKPAEVTIVNRFLVDVKCRSNFIRIGNTCLQTYSVT